MLPACSNNAAPSLLPPWLPLPPPPRVVPWPPCPTPATNSRRVSPPPFLPPSLPPLPPSAPSSLLPYHIPILIHPFLFQSHQTVYEDVWPLASTNTILNVCPQGERFVVERFGKLLDIKESGWFLGTYVLRFEGIISSLELLHIVDPLSCYFFFQLRLRLPHPTPPLPPSLLPSPPSLSHPLRGPHRLPYRHARAGHGHRTSTRHHQR